MSKTEDFLENDRSIPGQNFVCLSFLSPENVIKNRELFNFHKFAKSCDGLTSLSFEECSNQYEDFCELHRDKLKRDYISEFGMVTSVRGLKVRGVYDSIEEAQFRAKALQRVDSNFNVFVGQVGFWLPWDPSPSQIKNQEYANDQLNELMQKYNENQTKKDLFYEQNKETLMNKAKHENHQKQINKELERPDTWLSRKGATEEKTAERI